MAALPIIIIIPTILAIVFTIIGFYCAWSLYLLFKKDMSLQERIAWLAEQRNNSNKEGKNVDSEGGNSEEC